jgi:hypothetical protein
MLVVPFWETGVVAFSLQTDISESVPDAPGGLDASAVR